MAMREQLDYGAGYEQEANRRIEQNRKGHFQLRFEGENLPGQFEVSYRLKRHDFDFGCNIFMLEQYDAKEENERYLKLWKNVFNTAVVPLYWEGTEPSQGLLRYEDENGVKIYRRPPADMVLDFCEKNEITPKGHPLFWHEFIPKWLPSDWNEVLPLIEKRFAEISERYAERIPVFDLLNEPSRIWDMCFEHKSDGYKMLVPPEGYIEQIFELGEKYFPNNQLILNDTVGASFCDFRGIYGGYYQLLERLLKAGRKIDKIGLQCHTSDDPVYRNVFRADRFESLLDTYAGLGRELVISEISILSQPSEELQARAVEQMYRLAFANPAMSGLFWWNLDDNGILTIKNRDALGENLPSAGLVRNGTPKEAYRVLERLIHHEWHTEGKTAAQNGQVAFDGFYGTYEVTVTGENFEKTIPVLFNRNSDLNQLISL